MGQKITIRVLVSRGTHETPLCSYSPKLGGKRFLKTFNARRETSTREAKSKNKLAQEVARATADALNVRAILAFESIVCLAGILGLPRSDRWDIARICSSGPQTYRTG